MRDWEGLEGTGRDREEQRVTESLRKSIGSQKKLNLFLAIFLDFYVVN